MHFIDTKQIPSSSWFIYKISVRHILREKKLISAAKQSSFHFSSNSPFSYTYTNLKIVLSGKKQRNTATFSFFMTLHQLRGKKTLKTK